MRETTFLVIDDVAVIVSRGRRFDLTVLAVIIICRCCFPKSGC